MGVYLLDRYDDETDTWVCLGVGSMSALPRELEEDEVAHFEVYDRQLRIRPLECIEDEHIPSMPVWAFHWDEVAVEGDEE